jgi:hypothetical protein
MNLSSVRYVVVSPAPASYSYSAIQTLDETVVPESTQLIVTLNGVTLTHLTDYTINASTNQITLIGATLAGLIDDDVIIIRRDTLDTSQYVTFVDNSGLTAEDLNLSVTQVFFLTQEALDAARSAMQKDPTETFWDAKGISIENASPATTGNGLVTKNQVFDILGGAETAVVDAVEEWCLTGDGTTVTFNLPGIKDPSTSCEFLVSIDGQLIHCTCPDGGTWSTSPVKGGSGVLSMAQANLIDDTFSTGVCITGGPVTAATIVAALTALKALMDAQHLNVNVNYGIASSDEFYGSIEDAIAYFTSGAGAAGNGYYKYCPSDISIEPIAYNIDSAARTIEFSYPPKAGWKIQVRAWVGTVRADFAEESINGSALRVGTVTYDRLGAPATGFTTHRFIVFGTTGASTLTGINSSHIIDFDTSVRASRLDQMAMPTSSVNMNLQKITWLLSGTSATEAVNYGQLTGAVATINSTISVLQSNVVWPISGGFDQNYSGVPADMFFQRSWDARTAGVTPPALCDATKWRGIVCKEARIPGTGADPLMQNFVPRRLTIQTYGRLYTVDGSGNPVSSHSSTLLNHVFRFERWDENADIGFQQWATSIANVQRYRLTGYELQTNGSDQYTNTGLPNSARAWLEVEVIAPYRVWLRLETSSANPLALCKDGDMTKRGVIQIIAERGL